MLDHVAILRDASLPLASRLDALVPLLGASLGGSQRTDDAEATFAALQAAHRFLLPFVARGALAGRRGAAADGADGADAVQQQLRTWMRDKHQGLVALLLEQMQRHPEPGVQVPALGWLVETLVAESELLGRKMKAHAVDGDLFARIVEALLRAPRLHDALLGALADKHVNAHDDLRFHYLRALATVFERALKDETPPDEAFMENAFALLRDVVEMPTDEGVELGNARIKAAPGATARPAFSKLASLRKAFEDAWLLFLRLPLTTGLYKRVLVILNREVYPHMLSPVRLMDFLTDSFAAGGVASLLALNSLFLLMTKHNLDYPSFYARLYGLFDESVMTVKYRVRFFRMADAFLASTHLPAYLVAAFVKRLARLALVAPPPAAQVNIAFAYNLLLRHPQCLVLIHRSPQQAETAAREHDPYDAGEADPAKSRALESSLWELLVLKEHYDPGVARLAASFEQPLRKVPLDLEPFFARTLDSMFTAELRRPLGTPAVAFLPGVSLPPPGLFKRPADDAANGDHVWRRTSVYDDL